MLYLYAKTKWMTSFWLVGRQICRAWQQKFMILVIKMKLMTCTMRMSEFFHWGYFYFSAFNVNKKCNFMNCTSIKRLIFVAALRPASRTIHIFAVDSHDRKWWWQWWYRTIFADFPNRSANLPMRICHFILHISRMCVFKTSDFGYKIGLISS